MISASVGLRSIKLPQHSDFLLSTPACPSSPKPGVMADKEEQRDAENLWRTKDCKTNSAALTNISHNVQFYLIILFSVGILFNEY